MKFLSIYTPDAKAASVPPTKEHMAEMRKLVQESVKRGTLLATGMLLSDSKGGIRVRRSAGRINLQGVTSFWVACYVQRHHLAISVNYHAWEAFPCRLRVA